MRRVDDGGEVLDAVHAEVRHRARAALIFLGLELARPRAGRVVLHLIGNGGQRLRLGVTHHRRDQPARDRDRDPDVGAVMLEHAALGPGHVGVGNALQRERQRLDDEVVDRELVGRFAVLVLGRGGVDLLARGKELADVAVEREIEVRDGELGLDQPPRDHLADVVVWHDLVAAGLEQRPDLVVGRRLHRERSQCRYALAGPGRLDVAGDDAAMRAGAAHAAELDAGGLGKAARQRRGKDAVAAVARGGGRRCRWRGRCRGGRPRSGRALGRRRSRC